MVDASSDPNTFVTQINEALKALHEAIYGFIDDMASFVSDHLTEAGVLGGAAAGSFLGPIGMLGGALIGGLTGNQLEEKFEAACKEVTDKWKEAGDIIVKHIESIIGNPLLMSQIASDYRDAADKLGKGVNEIDDGNSVLWGNDFEGRAFRAYINVSTQQNAAVKGMQTQLLAAATVMDDNEVNLLKFWNQQLKNLIDSTALFLNVAGDLGDLGNAPLFESGPAVKAIGAIVKTAGDIITTYNTYLIDLNVKSAGNWDGLNSAFGNNGMPNDRWPTIGDVPRGAMNGTW